MQDDERLPSEAAPEPVVEPTEEAKVETPAEAEQPEQAETPDSPPEEKTDTQRRRERRKEHIRAIEEQAKAANERLERIKTAAEGDAAPKEDDFDDHYEYVAAKAVFDAAQRNTSKEVARAEEEVQALSSQRQKELAANFEAAKIEAATRYQDFDRVALNPSLPVSRHMGEVIVASDNGADVLYHLGANPSEALRISQLTPNEQVYELGRISGRLTMPRAKTVTQAPEPIKPVTARGGAQKDPSQMSIAEYKKFRGL